MTLYTFNCCQEAGGCTSKQRTRAIDERHLDLYVSGGETGGGTGHFKPIMHMHAVYVELCVQVYMSI